MNEKIKVYILPVIFCLVAMCMCLGAGIWLGRYPEYRTQQETKISGGVPVVIQDDLGDGE